MTDVTQSLDRICICVERCFQAQERRTKTIAFTVDYCVTVACLTVIAVAVGM